MTSRLALITGWLAAGHAALFGLFWVFLKVPESNVLMLSVSALVLVVALVLAAVVEGTALRLWDGGQFGEALRTLTRTFLPCAVALLLFALVWWLTGFLGGRWEDHRGEIDAWLMLHFGWTKTTRLHWSMEWFVTFLRYPVGICLAATAATAMLRDGVSAIARVRWIGAAFSPRRLAIVSVLLWLFVWLPWRGIYWRPKWVAPTWQEPAFVTVKLACFYLVFTLGWALVLGAIAMRGKKTETAGA